MRRFDFRCNVLSEEHHIALEAMKGQIRHCETHLIELVNVLGVGTENEHGLIGSYLDHVSLKLDVRLFDVRTGDSVIKGHRNKIELLIGKALENWPIPSGKDRLGNFEHFTNGATDKIRKIPHENFRQRPANLKDLEVGVDHLIVTRKEHICLTQTIQHTTRFIVS